MRANDTEGLSPHDADRIDLQKRDAKALTERMTAVARGGGIYEVTTESGRCYRVDAIKGRCTCPDWQTRQPAGGCKHLRRVDYALGERTVPSWVDREAIDPLLGRHVDGNHPAITTDGGENDV